MLGYRERIAEAVMLSGELAVHQGNLPLARRHLVEALAIYRDLLDKAGIAAVLYQLAALEVAQEKAERAARLVGASATVRERPDTHLAPCDSTDYDRIVAGIQAQLGEKALAEAQAEGKAMTLEQAIAYALGDDPG